MANQKKERIELSGQSGSLSDILWLTALEIAESDGFILLTIQGNGNESIIKGMSNVSHSIQLDVIMQHLEKLKRINGIPGDLKMPSN